MGREIVGACRCDNAGSDLGEDIQAIGIQDKGDHSLTLLAKSGGIQR